MDEPIPDQPLLWSEENSRQFTDYADYFVPERQAQFEIIAQLLPQSSLPIHVLELCCGDGSLAQTILKKYPNATLTGLDGSNAMLWKARQRLAPFGSRFNGSLFKLVNPDWRGEQGAYQAIVSSLAIHHLNGEEKSFLYRDCYKMLSQAGTLIIADLIEPASDSGRQLAAKLWDQSVMEQSLKKLGDISAFRTFQETHWNTHIYPDAMDMPSTLLEHFTWLKQAGFRQVDLYWMKAGHAIYGGVK